MSKRFLEYTLDGITLTVDWLMYQSYAFNRQISPHVAPERWRALYYYQDIYEKIYLKETTNG